jgi:hypothetical protein
MTRFHSHSIPETQPIFGHVVVLGGVYAAGGRWSPCAGNCPTSDRLGWNAVGGDAVDGC